MRKTIAIIGGGASGLMCAINIARNLKDDYEVIILERKDRIGKKILATGNGKCNITNMNSTYLNFYGDSNFAQLAITKFPPKEVLKFFDEIGLICKVEYGGRVYPYCEQASAVLDVMRNEIDRLNIKIITNSHVKGISKENELFKIETNEIIYANKVVVATGGKSNESLGSDGSGFSILKQLGHTIKTPTPVLVQLKTENSLTKSLKGLKVNVLIKAYSNGKELAKEVGEILFTDYGISGTAVLQLSRVLYENENLYVSIDFFPNFSMSQIIHMLKVRKQRLHHLTMEDFLVGTVSKKLGQVLIKKSGIEKLSLPVSELQKQHIVNISKVLKNLQLKVISHNGFNNSQVTAGGAITTEFNNETFESKKVKNLYAIGEVLDIFGDCGGYNLQWAWSSGYLAGTSIVDM